MKNKTEIIILAALLIMLFALAASVLTYLLDNFDIEIFKPQPEPGASAFYSVESLPPQPAQKTKIKQNNLNAVPYFAVKKT